MSCFQLIDNILIPFTDKKINGISCGFTLPYYGNMALTRESTSSGKSTVENRKDLSNYLGVNINRFFYPYQIHSDKIIYVDEKNAGCGSVTIGNAIQGDACITDKKSILLFVTWADCIPLLMFDPVEKIICAVHSGWKGTHQRIVEKSIAAFSEMGSKIENINVAIGPGIRDCCYKVGQEFMGYFKDYSKLVNETEKGIYFDLSGCVYEKCIESGIKKSNLEFYGHCTSCNVDPQFFSCRRH